jgi:cytoskeletal protein CcmA (bactofilin family)
MFEKFSQKSMSATSEKFDTIIGRTTTIQGTLILRDSVRIDGKVLGNIEADGDSKITVAVGPTGEIKGDIKAHRVMVAGKVAGRVSKRFGGSRRCLVWLDCGGARCQAFWLDYSKPSP